VVAQEVERDGVEPSLLARLARVEAPARAQNALEGVGQDVLGERPVAGPEDQEAKQGGFDAAQTQYEDDDDDGKDKKDKKDKKNKKDKDDDDDGDEAAPPGGGVLGARSCARAPFRTAAGFAACNRGATLAASGVLTPAQACGGFPVTLGRQAACVAAAGPPPPPPGTLP